MNRLPIFLIAVLVASWPAGAQAQPQAANGTLAPAPVNVTQDCWTSNLDQDPDPEQERYTFTTADKITFTWKQKLLVSCSSYRATIYVFQCIDGKPLPGTVRYAAQNIPYANIDPVPGFPELLFSFTTSPGVLPPGRYDWAMLTECNDTNGFIYGTPVKDGDVDDQCGISPARHPPAGLFPAVLGPEPLELLDADPGGTPPGRGPGEEGTTRGWCFEVEGVAEAAGASKRGVGEVPYYSGAAAQRRQFERPEHVRRGFDFMEQVRDPLQEQPPQEEGVPEDAAFVRNYPNPFRAETTIRYTLAESGAIKLTIYDALGRVVQVLVDEVKSAGDQEVTFDGRGLASGVYYYYVETATKKYMGKMVLQE